MDYVKQHSTVIIVTVYKNRYQNLVKYLCEETTLWNSHDIVLFRQENDPATEQDYLSLVGTAQYQVVTCDATDIRTKRKCYYDWAIECGYDKILVMDDDLEKICKYLDGTKTASGNSSKVKKAPLEQMISDSFTAADELDESDENWGCLSGSHSDYIGVHYLNEQDTASIQDKGYVLRKNNEIYVMYVLINVKRTKLVPNLTYQIGDVFEDKYFYADCLLNGLNLYTLYNYGVVVKNGMAKGSFDSTVWSEDHLLEQDICHVNQFKKYGGVIKMNSKGALHSTLNKKKLLGRGTDIPVINEGNKKLCAILDYLNTVEVVDKEVVGKVKEILKGES